MLRIKSPLSDETESIATAVLGCCVEVHKVLGPGFREPIYSEALCYELKSRGLAFEREKSIQVAYKGINIPGQRVDLIVGAQVLVELKAIDKLAPVHKAIVTSYLKTTGLRLGLLINFRAPTLVGCIKRIIF